MLWVVPAPLPKHLLGRGSYLTKYILSRFSEVQVLSSHQTLHYYQAAQQQKGPFGFANRPTELILADDAPILPMCLACFASIMQQQSAVELNVGWC